MILFVSKFLNCVEACEELTRGFANANVPLELSRLNAEIQSNLSIPKSDNSGNVKYYVFIKVNHPLYLVLHSTFKAES